MTAVDWKQRAKAYEREMRRLKKIEHAVWHALDDAAEYPEYDRVEITYRDWKRLSRLLPMVHP